MTKIRHYTELFMGIGPIHTHRERAHRWSIINVEWGKGGRGTLNIKTRPIGTEEGIWGYWTQEVKRGFFSTIPRGNPQPHKEDNYVKPKQACKVIFAIWANGSFFFILQQMFLRWLTKHTSFSKSFLVQEKKFLFDPESRIRDGKTRIWDQG